jgi:isopentenyl-diphosphate delta-isomerase
MRTPQEQVVLLDDDRRPIGTADKAGVHTTQTPLHLAFSCYVVDDRGRVLVTRRALSKVTWPGVWTNSVCGHPWPGEEVPDAVVRRARQELGLGLTDVTEVLPSFAYRAVDASGVVENEVCPVFTARADGDPQVDPGEVCEWRWVDRVDLWEAADRAPWALSPWTVLQLLELELAGWMPERV